MMLKLSEQTEKLARRLEESESSGVAVPSGNGHTELVDLHNTLP